VPQAALAASSPAAGPLDLIDFSAASTRAGNAVDEEVMWQKAVELGVHVVRGEACAAPRAGAFRVCWGAAESDEHARIGARRLAAAFLYEQETSA
jgi:hypothetical protein